jgi:hypothetical protein
VAAGCTPPTWAGVAVPKVVQMKKVMDKICEIECPQCKKVSVIRVNSLDYKDRERGKLIQEAFPYLRADQREMFITGICGKCWSKMFPEEEE